MEKVDKAVQLTVTEGTGDWVAPDLLQESALAALRKRKDVTVSLEAVEHLDASALQILIALAASLERDLHKLKLFDPPAALRRWFCLAGAEALLGPASDAPTNAEVS